MRLTRVLSSSNLESNSVLPAVIPKTESIGRAWEVCERMEKMDRHKLRTSNATFIQDGIKGLRDTAAKFSENRYEMAAKPELMT
jgi:hypothetical protein